MGVRGMQGGVRYDRDVVVAPPHGIFTKKIFVPPTTVSGCGWWVKVREVEEGVGFI